MIICKRPASPVDHLQEAGPSGWSFATTKRAWKFWDPSQWDRRCFVRVSKNLISMKKWIKMFTFPYGQGRGAWPPPPPHPPLMVSLAVKYPFFLTTSLSQKFTLWSKVFFICQYYDIYGYHIQIFKDACEVATTKWKSWNSNQSNFAPVRSSSDYSTKEFIKKCHIYN